MNADQITDLAQRLLRERDAATTAESAARKHWDAAQAIETRLREALHGNHTALLLAGQQKVAIITDAGVDLHDLVVLGSAPAEAPAPAAASASASQSEPAVTRATLRDLCREAAKSLGAEAVRALLGAKIDAIPEAEIAAKVTAVRAALAAKGAV